MPWHSTYFRYLRSHADSSVLTEVNAHGAGLTARIWPIIAECLSARQLIVQCRLKSQLAYIYIYICAQLLSRLGMQLNLRLRSLYVLLLCLYVPYTSCYYSCNETLPAPGAPRGASACSRWRPDELHGCCLCTSDARRNSDLDKSITSFYPGRLTTAPTRLEFV